MSSSLRKRKRLLGTPWTRWSSFWFHLRTDGLLTLAAGILLWTLYSLVRWSEELELGLALFAVLSAVLGAAMVKESIDGPSVGSTGLRIGLEYAMVIFVVVLAALLASAVSLIHLAWTAVAPFVVDTYRSLLAFRFRTWLTVAAGVVTLAIGSLFFWFRLRQRFLYGTSEAFAGAAVAAHRLSIEPGQGVPGDGGFYFAVLTAGVYLVVRGIDNMHTAMSSHSDPFLLWYQRLVANRRPQTDGEDTKPHRAM
jgi:hypothetical protein